MARISALHRTRKPSRNYPQASRLSSHELRDVGLAKHEISMDDGWQIDLLFTAPQDFN
jgi:hypothetical protein